ncbi:hypothetical protein QAD02_020091 [Eretmocerus hayati]|uniref:Uncharacterized protein n=1 Tax=Eretmocerus hayati TaxID=131215 RepID=A0ACC2PLX6_9HYME|nr:hypothetical protein QAD02_020091 [Eretmocerus hayati]
MLLENQTSFLHGRKPAGNVPIYALVKNCHTSSQAKMAPATTPATVLEKSSTTTTTVPAMADDLPIQHPTKTPSSQENLLSDELFVESVLSNNVPNSYGRRLSRSESSIVVGAPTSTARPAKVNPDERKRKKLQQHLESRHKQTAMHFHVTYWMFYPFSEGKVVCVLDLGFLGSWPIPSWGGVCLGKLKEYGSHVGDWEHVSLYFKGTGEEPLAMYVSAHDAGAFYRYESRSGQFVFESQETRKGIFQKPIFPERVYTAEGSHPVLFSARGSHGLWTAPGKHKFVRLPRLYDESGFGVPWPTWRKLELMMMNKRHMPDWMSFTGKWGNPKSNCHPLATLGFDICEFVDGPTGIPMKKMNFRC